MKNRPDIAAAVFVTILGFIAVSVPSAHAQGREDQNITGTVTDQSGAVVQGANVTVTNLATGITVELVSDSDGLYRTPPLKIGDYTVRVSKVGFQTLIRQGITLSLAETVRLDLTVSPGAVTQIVEVTGAAPVLNTEDPGVGVVVENKEVTDLPLTDRRAGGLIAMGPGVYYEGNILGAWNAPRFILGGSDNNIISIDGAGAAVPRTNVDQMPLQPPLEAIQEVQVQENYYSAQNGGSEGGMVRFTTRSGTNTFHGSLYEYVRNTIFDTRQFFTPTTKSPDNFNLYGGSVGGPIVKNRLFFFVNLERNTVNNPASGLWTVPTVAERSGNFSGLLQQGITIYDPATTRPDPAHPGAFIRDPFPGNIIPASRFDPVAVNLLSFYPSITQPGANNDPVSYIDKEYRLAPLVKVDAQLSSTDMFTASIQKDVENNSLVNLQPALTNIVASPNNFAWLSLNPSASYIFSETHTFSPALVNSLRVGHRSDSSWNKNYGDLTGWAAKLGIKNGFSNVGFPLWTLTGGYQGLGNVGPPSIENPPENDTEVYENVAVLRGKHTLKLGTDVVRSLGTNICNLTDLGQYGFNSNETALPGVGGGNAVASMLLGEVDTATLNHCANATILEWYIAPYVTDNIRATRKLTLEIGLRWDLDLPVHTTNGIGNGFDPYAINPVSGTPGVITFQGERGVPPGFYVTDKERFEPRFGFTYSPWEKTVIRGGYGIYGISPRLGLNNSIPTLGSAPVNVSYASPDGGLTPAFSLQNGLPARTPTVLYDGFGAVPVGQAPYTNVRYLDPYWHFGYSENFTLSIQHELPKQTLVEIAGLGNLGRKLSMAVDMNQLPPDLWGVQGNRQAERPFPQFGTVTNIKNPEGEVDYFALLAQATKKLSNGLVFIAAYTWQKSLGVLSYQANSDPKLSYGPNIWNESNAPAAGIPYHLLRVSTVYELPAGPGKRYFNSGWEKSVLGGWTVGGIYTYDSGLPFSLAGPSDSLNCLCPAGLRLSQIGSLKGPHTLNEWFNTSAVTAPVFGTMGNLGEDGTPGLVGPSFNNLDLSIAKNTNLTERVAAKFTLEVFNSTNTAKFGLPGTTFGSPTFGVISTYRGATTAGGFNPAWFGARIMQLGLRLSW